jgi:ferric-dicitrate binding protein FerR (iron transport regulator)
MKSPWESAGASPSPDDAALDRLVDGSLPEAERRELLLQLESDPDGWRRCALAFLEAQTWREALMPLAAVASTPRVAATTAMPRPAPSHRRLIQTIAAAACLAIAFGLGWVTKPKSVVSDGRVLGSLFHPSNVELQPMQKSPVEPSPLQSAAAETPVDSVIRTWEQHGYSAERHKTTVTVTLSDGSEVAIPADDIRLRYTAGRTY